MRRTLTLTAAIMAAGFYVAGCGGAKSAPAKPAPAMTTFVVSPDLEMVQTLDDLKLTIPPQTFTRETRVTVTRGTPDVLPPAGIWTGPNARYKIETSEPLREGPITIEFVNATADRGAGTKLVHRYLQRAGDTWRIISGVADDIKMKVEKAAFTAANRVDGVVGSLVVDIPEVGSGLIEMGGNPGGDSNNSLIIVHGFNSRADEYWLAANRLSTEPMEEPPRVIYGFVYDYRQSIRSSALELVKQIKEVESRKHGNVSILAHSMGVAVTRDAVENLGMGRYAVLYGYLVNGAHHGSVWATPTTMVKGLEEELINQPGRSDVGLLATCSDPVIADLTPGSPFLTNLNTIKSSPVTTAYFIIGTYGDLVVGPTGGAPDDIDFTRISRKVCAKRIISGTHSSLLQTSVGLNSLAQILFHQG